MLRHREGSKVCRGLPREGKGLRPRREETNMKRTQTIRMAALAAMSVFVLAAANASEPTVYRLELRQPADPVPALPDVTFNYGWSLSGTKYALIGAPIYERGGLSFDAVAGLEASRSQTPAYGLGLTWRVDTGRVFAGVGAYILAPQSRDLDVAIGATFGWRF